MHSPDDVTKFGYIEDQISNGCFGNITRQLIISVSNQGVLNQLAD